MGNLIILGLANYHVSLAIAIPIEYEYWYIDGIKWYIQTSI